MDSLRWPGLFQAYLVRCASDRDRFSRALFSRLILLPWESFILIGVYIEARYPDLRSLAGVFFLAGCLGWIYIGGLLLIVTVVTEVRLLRERRADQGQKLCQDL